jgi:metallo-beta-lactamase family protein
MKITFHGAAQTVTGSKHLIELDNGKKILLDCGLFQGEGEDGYEWNAHFGFDPMGIDAVILSHAHIDHTGLLPKLVREGFSGPIYCTSSTKDLCELMLLDSAYIQESDVARANKRRERQGRPLIKPLYEVEDVEKAMRLFKCLEDQTRITLFEGCDVIFTPMAHIIGSVAVSLITVTKSGEKTLTFSGDIGRPNDKLLDGPFALPASDYLLCESTYGNKLHPKSVDVEATLLALVKRICVENNGKLIIPAFSVDRTQELIYLLDRLSFEKKLPLIKVFVDSPLSVRATNVMRDHKMDFNKEALEYISRDGDPFDFPYLTYVTDVEESKRINNLKEPCIIISSSGMATAGRIKHHIANNVSDDKNCILLLGYAAPYSLAGQLRDGAKEVRIFGDEYKVNAHIEVMDYFSAHADYDEMLELLEPLNRTKLKELFLVHGNLEAMEIWKDRLTNAGFNKITIPAKGETFELK